MREYRYGQALDALSSEDSDEASVLKFVISYHLGRLNDAATLLETIDVRTISERDSFDQVQFFLVRGSLESERSDVLAEKNYREAIRRAKRVDDEILAKLSLANLILYRENSVNDEIKKLFEEAGLLLPKANHPSTLSYYLRHQARLLGRSGLKEGKAPLYFAALEISENADLPLVSASSYRDLAEYFKRRHDHQEARKYQQKAIRVCLAENEW